MYREKVPIVIGKENQWWDFSGNTIFKIPWAQNVGLKICVYVFVVFVNPQLTQKLLDRCC